MTWLPNYVIVYIRKGNELTGSEVEGVALAKDDLEDSTSDVCSTLIVLKKP